MFVDRLMQFVRPAPCAPEITPVLSEACAAMLLHDCEGHQVRVLRRRMGMALRLDDMRMLRPTLFDCIALHRGEGEAARRIGQLDRLMDDLTLSRPPTRHPIDTRHPSEERA